MKKFFSDGKLESLMRTVLAQLLIKRQADGEAREVFHPTCATLGSGTPDGLSPDWVESVCRR